MCEKKGQHKRPNCTWINMTRAWGGLTSILFNLLQSKKYKANRHSQPPYSIKLIIKKISRAYKSRILKKKGELTCIKIEYSVLPFTEIEGKKTKCYKSPHTTHVTPHSSLRCWQKDLYWYPQTLPYRAAGRSAQGSHYLQNSTCEQRFTCSVIVSQLFGDEVANTEESTVLMCL